VRNICKIAIDIIDELDPTSIDCAKNGHFCTVKREKKKRNRERRGPTEAPAAGSHAAVGRKLTD
jgi:hypothetical protein